MIDASKMKMAIENFIKENCKGNEEEMRELLQPESFTSVCTIMQYISFWKVALFKLDLDTYRNGLSEILKETYPLALDLSSFLKKKVNSYYEKAEFIFILHKSLDRVSIDNYNFSYPSGNRRCKHTVISRSHVMTASEILDKLEDDNS